MARASTGPDIPAHAAVLAHDHEGVAYQHGQSLVIDMAYQRQGQVHVVLPTDIGWLAQFYSFLEAACEALARRQAAGG